MKRMNKKDDCDSWENKPKSFDDVVVLVVTEPKTYVIISDSHTTNNLIIRLSYLCSSLSNTIKALLIKKRITKNDYY